VGQQITTFMSEKEMQVTLQKPILVLVACLLSFPAVAQTGPIPAPPGLVAWWAGDGDARDLAGTNNGTMFGGVGFTNGMVGQAFAFNSNGAQVLATAVGLPIRSADRSIEFWVRIDEFVAGFPYGDSQLERHFS
jgi:hypothetical protein